MKSGNCLLNKTLIKQNITEFFFIQLLGERSIILHLFFKHAAEDNVKSQISLLPPTSVVLNSGYTSVPHGGT